MPDKARAGDVAAMLALAGSYAQRPTALRDGAAARESARHAAEIGSADAALDLALALATGVGGPVDAARTRTWYERAAPGGRPRQNQPCRDDDSDQSGARRGCSTGTGSTGRQCRSRLCPGPHS